MYWCWCTYKAATQASAFNSCLGVTHLYKGNVDNDRFYTYLCAIPYQSLFS